MNIVTRKEFKTSEMPEDVWPFFLELIGAGCFPRDGLFLYEIGYFAKEARNDVCGNPEQIEFCDRVDKWFTDQGAVLGEKVLIEHG